MITEDFAAFFRELCRFDDHLGMRLEIIEPGCIRYRLRVDERHLSMPDTCHGGVLAAMMDAVLGLTVLSRVFPEGKMCQTVEFKINYLAGVGYGALLEGSGDIEFAGSRLMVISGGITDTNDGRQIAKGMGTFSLYPLDRKRQLYDLLPDSYRRLATLEASQSTP